MFVSAGSLNVLVEFLDEDYDSARDLVLIGVNGIWSVFELQGPTPKNDFCRIFSRSKILDPLALVLHRVLDEDSENELTELIEGRIVNIFYLFSQAGDYVKEMVADRQVLKSILKDLRRMTPAHQITMLKFIKNLSMLSTTLEALHAADAIDLLIELLSNSMKNGHSHFREISNQVLNTMFNLCRLSKDRQEYAAVNGIIPLLLEIMKTERPPKEFALPILCDIAHSGSKGRRFLWQNKGLDFYISLLADQYWQVTAMDAIFVWLQEETAKVEGHLINCQFTDAIVSCFNTHKINAFDPNLLEPLLKVLRISPSLAASLVKSAMYSGIAQKLSHKKAVVRLNLLRLVRNILEARESDYFADLRNKQLGSLVDAIRVLAEKDSAVLVRNLASDMVSLIDGSPDQFAMPLSAPPTAASSRARSGGRRVYTPPSLHSSTSVPITPHSAPRASHAHSQSSAYIEVASNSRRSAASLAPERDHVAYRPKSRDDLTNSGALSRAPRTPGIYVSRPSLGTPTGPSRSESLLSNKGNMESVAEGPRRHGNRLSVSESGNIATTGASSSTRSTSGRQRRSRAPSEGKQKWST
ncbi:armadillo-type protein [Rostrohypoxylon terebratum]|nr:armadillo-type protein [Rostrohypoxylon terebratum]